VGRAPSLPLFSHFLRWLFFPNSPEAVNVSNMAALIDADGKPHFKYIVEGANLFVTQQARMFLEKRKVILFKDSSANKGERSFHLLGPTQNSPFFFSQVVSQVVPWKSSLV
jgi:hypothetical protein